MHFYFKRYSFFSSEGLSLCDVLSKFVDIVYGLPNPFSDYCLDWTPPDLSLVDLEVVFII